MLLRAQIKHWIKFCIEFKWISSVKKRFLFLINFYSFKRAESNRGFTNKVYNLYPCLNDNTENTGFDGHYIYHPAWAIRKVKEINPKVHYDFSSILSFPTMLSAFVPVEYFDYRPANLILDNLNSSSADLTNLHLADNSIHSLSCMHTIEHIGLGRYGDRIDPNGDIKALEELKRVCQINGYILFVTPVGSPKIFYNAHRVYSYEMIIEYFSGFNLLEFSLVLDDGSFVSNASPSLVAEQKYGCGCFLFKKN